MSIRPVPFTNAGANVSHQPAQIHQGSLYFRAFQLFPDLLNGDHTGYQPIYLAPGLPEPYYWPSSGCFGALPAITDEASLNARTVFEATIYSRRLHGTIADEAVRRRVAIVLAVARTAVRRSWNIHGNDIIATQRLDRPIGVAVSDLGVLSADWNGVGTVAEFAQERLAVGVAFNAVQNTWVPQVAKLGLASPVVVGVILVLSNGHHFIPSQRMTAYAVMNEVLGSGIRTVDGLDAVTFEDTVWHKVCHPIVSGMMVHVARSQETVTRFAGLHFNSPTVRVPVQYAPEKAAGAIKNLVDAAAGAGARHNVAVRKEPVDQMVADVQTALTPNPTPATIEDAAKVVHTWKAANKIELAWCMGFYHAMVADNPGGVRGNTTLGALTLREVAQCVEGTSAGAEHYSNAVKWARTMARNGNLIGVGLFGADAPPNRNEDGGVPGARQASGN